MSLRQPVYVPATATRPRSQRLGWRRRTEDGEGSSTESQADLYEMPPDLSAYVDHVIDAQYPEYVVIEASPRETGEEVGLKFFFFEVYILYIHTQVQPSPSPQPVVEPMTTTTTPRHNMPITSTMFLDSLMSSLSARTDDQRCLFTLCLLYALVHNKGTIISLSLSL